MKKDELTMRVAELEGQLQQSRAMQEIYARDLTNRNIMLCGDIISSAIRKTDADRTADGVSEPEIHLTMEWEDENGNIENTVACFPLAAVRFSRG